MDAIARLETSFFERLNRMIEPLVRAGFGSPCPGTTGLILLETKGRNSGRTISVPLIAAALGNLMVVSTVRGRRSQWVRNLAATPKVRYWAHGRRRAASAVVIADDQPTGNQHRLPRAVRGLVLLLRSLAAGQLTFAVLMPAGSN